LTPGFENDRENIRLMIFDLDGTLAATGQQIALAVQASMKNNNLTPPSVDEICHYIGNGAEKLIKRSLVNSFDYNDDDIDPELYERVRRCYFTEYMEGITRNFTLYPGVKDTLERLKSRGILLAIATNKPDIYVQRWVDAAELTGIFDFTLGSGVIPKVKPDPEVLFYVCENLDVLPSQAVMVGDTCNDILAAKAAGICSVGLTYGYNYLRPLEEYQPDYVFDDFRDLLKLL
jgi:phosphoglycolate phosphatase